MALVNGIDTSAHLGLVRSFIKRNKWLLYHSSFEHEDLMNEGWLAIREAAMRFDHSRGVRFSTFAWHYVRLRLTRHYEEHSRTVRVPTWKQQEERLAGSPITTHAAEYNDEISVDQSERPDETVERKQLNGAVAKALCSLTDAEAVVVRGHVMDGKTLRQVAAPVSRSGEWARLHCKKALKALAKDPTLSELAEAT